MPDFGAPVVSASNAFNPIQTLSAVLGLKQQQQQLQTSTAQAYQATQSANERQNLAQVNWKQFQKDDGSFDMPAVTQTAISVAPTIGQDFASRFATMATGAAETQKAYYSLNQQYQDSVRSLFGAWGGDPNSDMADLAKQRDVLLENTPASSRPAVKQIIDHSLSALNSPDLLDGSPKPIEKQKQQAMLFSRAGLGVADVSGSGGVSTTIPGTTINPQGQVSGTTQSRVTGAVSGTPGGAAFGLSAAQLAQPFTLPNGQITTLGAFLGKSIGGAGGAQPAPNAPVKKPTPAPVTAAGLFFKADGSVRTAQDDAPPANAPKATQDSYNGSVALASQHVAAIRNVDDQYGNNVSIANAIRRLSANTSTGPGTQQWHNVMGALGAPGDLNNVANYQQLGAWLDRQAAQLRPVMGLPGTNEGQATAQAISGNTSYQPEAIQAKNDFNQALTEGVHQYRRGLDRVEGFTGTPSPKAIGAYRSQWTQNYDPVVYELENAKGDPAAVSRIISQLTPEQAATLKQKRANLRRLSVGEAVQ